MKRREKLSNMSSEISIASVFKPNEDVRNENYTLNNEETLKH
jgi:hypothetical protein